MHALHQVLHAFFNPHSYTLAMPDVWAGFQVNLRMMAIAEVLVLALALGIAIVRGLPGPAARPLRALAIAYADFFRGTPIINSTIKALTKNGTVGKLQKKWFNIDFSKVPVLK